MTAQLSAPAIGYRAFKWDGSGPLKSVGVSSEWPISREPQQAICNNGRAHAAPQESCSCGFYAHSRSADVPKLPPGVGAVILGYGNLIIHPDGWRAQFAELVALVPYARTVGLSDPSAAAIEMCAEQYGVRVLSWEDAASVARELGAEPVPEILHAEAEGWQLGPEKREPLFPDGMAASYGDAEQRVREALPWLERHMIGRMDIQMVSAPMAYYVAAAPMTFSVGYELRLSIVHPELRAEVEITLRI